MRHLVRLLFGKLQFSPDETLPDGIFQEGERGFESSDTAVVQPLRDREASRAEEDFGEDLCLIYVD